MVPRSSNSNLPASRDFKGFLWIKVLSVRTKTSNYHCFASLKKLKRPSLTVLVASRFRLRRSSSHVQTAYCRPTLVLARSPGSSRCPLCFKDITHRTKHRPVPIGIAVDVVIDKPFWSLPTCQKYYAKIFQKINCSAGRIRTCDQSVTRIHRFLCGVDYIITQLQIFDASKICSWV